MRVLRASFLFASFLVACGGSSSSVGDAGASSSPSPTDPGASAQRAACQGGANAYVAGKDAALAAARCPVEIACQRLWGECSSVCASPFAACGTSYDDCVRLYTQRYTDSVETPFADFALAGDCAAQVTTRSCGDLEPETLACKQAVVSGCPEDADGYGANYGFAAPYAVPSLPATLTPTLCRDVAEWFAVDVPAGAKLAVDVTPGDAKGSVRFDVYGAIDDTMADLPPSDATYATSHEPSSFVLAGASSSTHRLVRVEAYGSSAAPRITLSVAREP